VPKDYIPEQVKQIDLKNQPKTRTIIIVVVVAFFFIFIIGLISSVVLLALNSARAKSRDAKRITDVRQIENVLELYFHDNSKYPNSLNDLVGPKYMGELPTAPTPADGNCNTDNNKYKYILFTNNNYQLTFCLGAVTGGYPAGVQTLTPKGIGQNNITSLNTQPDGTGWQLFNATDGSFKILFPASPTREDSTDKVGGGITINTAIYSSSVSNSNTYILAVYKYSNPLDPSKADVMLEGAIKV